MKPAFEWISSNGHWIIFFTMVIQLFSRYLLTSHINKFLTMYKIDNISFFKTRLPRLININEKIDEFIPQNTRQEMPPKDLNSLYLHGTIYTWISRFYFVPLFLVIFAIASSGKV